MINKKGPFECICLIKFGPESEVIHALPVASAIKRNLPYSRLIWITDESGIHFINEHKDIDCVFVWKRNEWIRDFPYPHKTISVLMEISSTMFKLKKERINVVLDLEGSFISALMSKWTGCSLRIGLDYKDVQSKWIRGLYTYLLTIPQERLHAFERNLLILKGIGIKEGRRFVEIMIPEEIQREADLFLEEKIPYPDHPLLGIYAGANYKSRCWQPEKFAQLIDKLNEDLDINCLLLWLPGELDLIKSIEREMETVPIRAYAARGKSLLALIKRCNLLISADSALIQMANVAKVPVLGLFGPSSPQKTGPVGPDDKVIQGSLSCVPCEKLYCSNPLCMKTIQVDKVVYIVEKMLSEKFKFKRLE